MLWKLFLRGLQNDVSLIPAVRWQLEAEILLGPARDGQWHLAWSRKTSTVGIQDFDQGVSGGKKRASCGTIESLDCCMQGDPVQKLCS